MRRRARGGVVLAAVLVMGSGCAIAERYRGPFTVDLESALDLGSATLRWDGADFSLRQVPASPIEEWRVVTEDGVTTCYQQIDGSWVFERSQDPKRPSLLDGIASVASYNDLYSWDPKATSNAAFRATAERISLSGLHDPDTQPGPLDRIDFDLEDGHLTGATFRDVDGDSILIERYSYDPEPDIAAPAHSSIGMDVSC